MQPNPYLCNVFLAHDTNGTEDPCQRLDLYYDTNPLKSGFSANIWGRLAAAQWGGTSCAGGLFQEMYSYTNAGLPTNKELRRKGQGPTLDAAYTYDNEGKLVSTQYPNSGPTLTYTFDAMSRPIRLTDNQAVDWAKDVIYNAAGQMTQLSTTNTTGGTSYRTETRQYNALGQMTQLAVPGVMGYQYTYSATQNNGQITQRTDAISGEVVN